MSLAIERHESLSEPGRELEEHATSRGTIAGLRLEPTDPDEPSEWRGQIDGLTVTCTHDSVSVTRDDRGELRTVAKGEVTGPAAAEVTLWLDREDGAYYLSVDFFGPALPIRVERFRNGASEGSRVDDSRACSFRQDAVRPLRGAVRSLSGSVSGGEPPWSRTLEWRLQRGR